MLHEFLTTNREELVSRCRAKAAKRVWPLVTKTELEHGIPVFLNQLGEILRTQGPASNRHETSVAWEEGESSIRIAATATNHGKELLSAGFTVDQVVHDYGDLCQAVTELAMERKAQISINEFQILNRCLDDAIANAVSEFARQRTAEGSLPLANGKQKALENELRLVNTAMLCVDAIKNGHVGIFGSTGAVLDSVLKELQELASAELLNVCPGAVPPDRKLYFSSSSR